MVVAQAESLLNTSTVPPSRLLPLIFNKQFVVFCPENELHQVQSRGGYGSCSPVLCFTCNLIFNEIHFLLSTRNRIKRKGVKVFNSSDQSCQYLTWSAHYEIPEGSIHISLHLQ